MLQDYLSLAEAIRKYNGISLGYLTRLVKAGTIEGEKIGNQWVVKEQSLRNWLAQRGKIAQQEQAEA